MARESSFNPLDTKNLAESVAKALLSKSAHQLPPKDFFTGAGIYALYYRGGFAPYSRLASLNKRDATVPIYVGKAIEKGRRKGAVLGEGAQSNALYSRLKEHAESIDATSTLKLDEFSCRYLVVEAIWIPLAESLLISQFSPLWNLVIDGFGNHDPGAGRYNQKRSPWDVIHPGRPFAKKCKPSQFSSKEILARVDAAMARI